MRSPGSPTGAVPSRRSSRAFTRDPLRRPAGPRPRRSRPFQERQRPVRPSGRRRGSAEVAAARHGGAPRDRRRRALGRRGVRAHPPGHRARRRLQLAERLRAALAAAARCASTSAEIRVTASFGVAAFPETSPSGRSSRPRTARSTRRSASGRNRVVAVRSPYGWPAVPALPHSPLKSLAAPSPSLPRGAVCRSTHRRSSPRSSRSTWS